MAVLRTRDVDRALEYKLGFEKRRPPPRLLPLAGRRVGRPYLRLARRARVEPLSRGPDGQAEASPDVRVPGRRELPLSREDYARILRERVLLDGE